MEMPIAGPLQEAEKLEIAAYKKAKDPQEIEKTHVSFSGLPKKPPLVPDRVILIPDPLATRAYHLEFRSEDISFIEELPQLINAQGEVFPMAKIWNKKNSVAIRFTPFLVNDIWEL